MITTIKVFENFFNVHFESCESSNIEGYAYYPDGLHTDILVIFKSSPNICYRYIGAGKIFNDLKKAESKGKWVNANLVKTNEFNIKKYEYK